MPTETTETSKSPSKEAVAKAQAKAKEHLEELKRIFHMQRTSTMEIGWIARLMKEKSEFATLGMEENECRENIGIERATWYRSIQIAEGLKNLPKKRFLELYSGKAYQLLRLPEKERYKDVWLDRAADPKMTEAALTEMIDAKIDTGEVKQDVTSTEERSWLKIRMYKSALDVVMQKLTEFCSIHGLGDDFGRALELILVEKSQRGESILAVIQNRLPELKATVELLKDAKRPAEDRCVAFEKTATAFITDLARAAGLKTKGAK